MSEITPLFRRAHESDYNWSDEFQCYVLQFEPRFRPGVMAESPAVGALEYNHYLDHRHLHLRAAHDGIDRLREYLSHLVDGLLDPAVTHVARPAVLYFLDPNKYSTYAQTSVDAGAILADEELETLMLAFWHRAELPQLLSFAQVARLALASPIC